MNKKTQKTMFSSAKQDWETPQEVFDELNAKYGPLMLDVCASPSNTKCENYITEEYTQTVIGRAPGNGLKYGWYGKCWMNPPYGREIGKWVKKAYEESQKGCLVVALLPSRTDTKWFHDYCYEKHGVEVKMLRGRLKFGGASNSAPFPSMVVVFNPPKEK